MVGITPEMLEERGYDPSIPVPSVEEQIDACIPLTDEDSGAGPTWTGI